MKHPRDSLSTRVVSTRTGARAPAAHRHRQAERRNSSGTEEGGGPAQHQHRFWLGLFASQASDYESAALLR
jgi:hypothetical protein